MNILFTQELMMNVLKKCHYNENGQKTKEKEINVRKVFQNRRSHRNVDDFFEDMVRNYGYHKVNY